MSPSAPAEPVVLVRRLYLDLIGVPPTPNEVEAFLTRFAIDPDAAVAEQVDRLLDHPGYGERWGRHWLDVARYSDGFGGFLDSAPLPNAWRYRDWVVRSLNEDMPFDEFIRWQVAGDLLGGFDGEIATGFLALGPTYTSDGGDPESVAQAHAETLNDRVDTVTRGILGVTVACSRCHDHKFDPLPQADYYALAGIFNNTAIREAPLAEADRVAAFDQHQSRLAESRARLKELNETIQREARDATAEEIQNRLDLETRIGELESNVPPAYDKAHALTDTGQGDMPIALRGNPRRPGEIAPRKFLTLFDRVEWPEQLSGSGRIALADALVDAENPLTSRVIVNRIWLRHFGQGIVRTPSNFGTLGELPSHPALLDWLAHDLMRNGWSLKSLHRRIMTSATYRQSSRFDEARFSVDGDNRWLWRQNPRRLDVEAWRDSLLAVTGELDPSQGGPPIDDITASTRRTLYARVSRAGDRFRSDLFLRTFDFPLMQSSVEQRPTSIVPQQYLFMLNSDFFAARARAFARRLEAEATTVDERIRLAYALLYGRAPTEQELRLGRLFVSGGLIDSDDGVDASSDSSAEDAIDPSADIVLADFEGATYDGWQAEGEAFGTGPAQGTLPGQMVVTGFAGRGLVNSFLHGDGSTGTLTSPPFAIERRYLAFLVGGGAYEGVTCIDLVIDGRVVRSATGPNDRPGGSEKLSWQVWDLDEFQGQTARLRIVDQATGGWGHINVDHIVATNSSEPPVAPIAAPAEPASRLSLWEQYAQVLLGSNEFMYVR
ncbi:MAG: DUF1549 and DUF1553 domain-containing protein [Pirellulaceae bacterium]